MPAETTEILAELMAGQTDLTHGQREIIAVLGTQGELLRLIAERLGILLEKLTPEIGAGPTMQELLVELVTRVGDNGALLRRIDRRTENMALDLLDDVGRAMKEARGADRLDANGAAGS
jgi:hypothetical protein